MNRHMITVDGNTACAYVAHATNEIITIYPITPSSPMAELCDARSVAGKVNIWGSVPNVVEMQSEGGASGSVHGSLTTGALTTTFTASQGLLLMIPNMFKIAGELTPTVFHVASRSVACQALSIFDDHSDVMATRSTGFAMLCSKDVQQVMDFALIAQAASLKARVPFVHFFDGFRTSHEIQKIEELTFDDMRAMIDDEFIFAHRRRGLSPDRPAVRGTSQNPDVFFQARETVNGYYNAAPEIVQQTMDRFADLVGRRYRLFDYSGHPEAERVIVVMGSAADTVRRVVEALNGQGERVGLLQVALFRPFSAHALVESLPATVKAVAVLDRTKEPGSLGEPLYLDVRSSIGEAMEAGTARFATSPKVLGGRYGLGGKEFNPAMAKAVFDNLSSPSPKNHFTVGIDDDAGSTSLLVDESFSTEDKGTYRAMFYGLGSDGTVGANKNTIKIIGAETDNFAQGYFVYDSKKSGALTISFLRFGARPIRDPYLISSANFIACHNPSFLDKYDMLRHAEKGATFLLNTPHSRESVWDMLPRAVQEQVIEKRMRFYIIDAISLAEEIGLGARINMIMQTAFFVISGIIPEDQAIAAIKQEIEKTYGSKGTRVVEMNYTAVDRALMNIVEVPVPDVATGTKQRRPAVPPDAPDFVRNVTARMIEGRGDVLPVSSLPEDGTWPTGTTRYEKRNIAVHIPVWEPDVCIQCGQCSFACPHATIRINAYEPALLEGAPPTFKSADARGAGLEGLKFTVQVAPEDCTGCGSCVFVCPASAKGPDGRKIKGFKAINMRLQEPIREQEAENYRFFLGLPHTDPARYSIATVKGSQLAPHLFEYHGACAGCGETPYIRLLAQLFGDRLLIANATGCSSIYGGNLPTSPYAKRVDGRGPTWSNSLFEDNAEFGLGMRQTVEKFREQALELAARLAEENRFAGIRQLLDSVRSADQSSREGIEEQRKRVADLKSRLAEEDSDVARHLLSLADYLVTKTVWAVGGDGWAYDIGYGGLDHVLASGRNINVLVLDTEVYSNTGGQMSKSTPLGAVAPFAAGGKRTPKKNLGMMTTIYGNVYVAQIAFGANQAQAVKAFVEADAYDGPSLIIAYSTCIAHGIDMGKGIEEQKKAVACGHWPLFRFNPTLRLQGNNPLVLDSKEPTLPVSEYAYGENRYRILGMQDPELAARLIGQTEIDVKRRWSFLKHMAGWIPEEKVT
jgi:pyruvate-ferredoxin/flavodoxin oxidoreductase